MPLLSLVLVVISFTHCVLLLYLNHSSLTPLSRFLFNKGCRVAIRGKVNEPLHTGLRVVDTILTLGKGQRQLIIGDRVSGKTSVYVTSIYSYLRVCAEVAIQHMRS